MTPAETLALLARAPGLAEAALADEQRGTLGVWQDGIAGHCNLVAFDGDDIVGVAEISDHNRVVIVNMRTREPLLASAVLAYEAERGARWSCPRCGRSDLTVAGAKAHSMSCMSATDEDAATAERDALRAETVRLTTCLAGANDNHEHFERLWYLVQDERDAALRERDEARQECDEESSRALLEKGHALLVSILEAFASIGIVAPNGRTAAEDIRALGAERDALRAELAEMKLRIPTVAIEAARAQVAQEHAAMQPVVAAAVAWAKDEDIDAYHPVIAAQFTPAERALVLAIKKYRGGGLATIADAIDAQGTFTLNKAKP